MKTNEKQKPPTRMSKSQIEYVRERLHELKKTKIGTPVARYAIGLLNEEIEAGRFRVKPKREIQDLGLDGRSDLHEAFYFAAYPAGLKDAEKMLATKQESYDLRAQKIREAVMAIEDDLVLGDATEALAALRSFEKREF